MICYAFEGLARVVSCQPPGLICYKGPPLASLSVTVITKNEASNIEACLRSVQFADQVVVLDSGSTDNTVEIARHMGAEVSVRDDWKGFGIQKNRALGLATCEWVLSLDADERVTPELQVEIQAALKNSTFDVYAVPRLSSYCGQFMRYSGWHPDYVTRLFRQNSARFSDDLVHEKIITLSKVGILNSSLLHESFKNFESVLDKVDRYSTAGAEILLSKGKKTSLTGAIGHGFWAFIRTYFLRLGFLDGRMGLVLAISNAEGTYYRYLKLWLLCRNSSKV